MELYPSALSSSQKEYFVNTSKRLLEKRILTYPVERCFTWKLEFSSNILSVVVAETIILGCFWMIFWPELPKILSILFKIFDQWWHARWCIRYATAFIEVLSLKLGKKTDLFGSFLEVFVYSLWHPMNYAPRFWQMKNLIKIRISDKFHQYSICGCEVKNFQSFLYWFSVHKMIPFGMFLGSYSPKYCLILLKFWPEVVSKKRNTIWIIPQNFAFWLKWDTPKIYSFGPFWPNLLSENQKYC